jgi:methionine--tRNA ligase beta chain
MPDPQPSPSPTSPAPAAAAPTPSPATGKPMVTFEEFAKLDLRVAKVVQAENHPKADKLLKLQVDDGSGTPRQICAGIKGNYAPEQLVGKLIVIVANLAPRVIRGEESRGMLLAASDVPKEAATESGAERKVIVLTPAGEIAPGSIVS